MYNSIGLIKSKLIWCKVCDWIFYINRYIVLFWKVGVGGLNILEKKIVNLSFNLKRGVCSILKCYFGVNFFNIFIFFR